MRAFPKRSKKMKGIIISKCCCFRRQDGQGMFDWDTWRSLKFNILFTRDLFRLFLTKLNLSCLNTKYGCWETFLQESIPTQNKPVKVVTVETKFIVPPETRYKLASGIGPHGLSLQQLEMKTQCRITINVHVKLVISFLKNLFWGVFLANEWNLKPDSHPRWNQRHCKLLKWWFQDQEDSASNHDGWCRVVTPPHVVITCSEISYELCLRKIDQAMNLIKSMSSCGPCSWVPLTVITNKYQTVSDLFHISIHIFLNKHALHSSFELWILILLANNVDPLS